MVRWLLNNLQYQLYLKDDILVKASDGSDGAKMIMVIQGTVAVYTPNWREVLHLEDGEHFGEYQLVLGSSLMVRLADERYMHITVSMLSFSN